MTKYSFDFKMQVVNDYLNGNGGYRYLAQKYGIPQKSTVRNWVNAYNTMGANGLKRSYQNKVNSFEFKLHAVDFMHRYHIKRLQQILQSLNIMK